MRVSAKVRSAARLKASSRSTGAIPPEQQDPCGLRGPEP